MVLPVQQFRPLSMAEASPFGGAIQNALKWGTQGAQLEAMRQQNKVRPQSLEAQLQAQLIKNQYMPQQMQAGIDLTQARIPLTQAQTGQVQERTRLMPADQDIAAQRAFTAAGQLGQSQSRFGPMFQLTRFAQTPFGQSLLSKNQDFANAYGRIASGTATMADQDLVQKMSGINMQAQGQQRPSNLLPAFQERFGAPSQGAPSVEQQLAQQQPMQPVAQFTPEQIQAAQEATESKMIKGTTPESILKQRQFSLSVNNMLKEVEPNLKIASKYAGMKGATGKKFDQFFRKGSPEYEAYMTFTRTQMPIFVNEFRKELGGQATDFEQKLMEGVANPVTWDSTPKLAMQQFDALKRMALANEKALGLGTAESKARLIEETREKEAKLLGKVEDKELSIPSTVKSDAEFSQWLSTLTPSQRQSVLARYGG